jgi:mannosylglycerate hydrolase
VNEWLLLFFDALFDRMEKQKDYQFILDGQTLIIEDALEAAKKSGRDGEYYRRTIKQYTEEKRLFIGPYYMQPDWQLASEEALVRNLLYGQKIAAQYGGSMKAGWLLDNFGQIAQAPQIHQGFGLDGVFLWRGVGMDPREVRTEFEWLSPDGSRVTAVYLLASYRNAMRLAKSPEIIKERIYHEAVKLEPFTTTDNILLMNGYDQETLPDDILPSIRDGRINKDGYKVVQSSPETYLAAIRSQGCSGSPLRLSGPLYNGRFVSVFPGILSSRMYIKQRNDELQNLMEHYAEPVSTIASLLGHGYPEKHLEEAWKLILKNHPHDSISGVGIDDVHTDMLERYDRAEEILDFEVQGAMKKMVSHINTAASGNADQAFVVFNTLPFPRNEVLFLPIPPGEHWRLTDEKNEILEMAAIHGGCRVFLKGIPPYGYKTIYATAQGGIDPFPAAAPGFVLENTFLKVEIKQDGTLRVFEKGSKKVYEDILIFEDSADCGDEYNYSHIKHDLRYYSNAGTAKITMTEYNALRQTCKIETSMKLPGKLAENRKSRSPEMRELPLVTWVTLDQDSPVVRFKTTLKNTVKDHRLRALFPTDIKSEASYSRTQFDITKHPVCPPPYEGELPEKLKRVINGACEPEPSTEFPQLSFAGIEDDRRGAAVINKGLREYSVIPGRNTIALTLLRAVGFIAHSDLLTRTGDAGPLMATPDAQCLREMTFTYGFYPYKGNQTDARVRAWADAFTVETPVWSTTIHPGVLPPAKQFFSIQDKKGVAAVSCLKRSENKAGVIIRLYNNSGAGTDVEIGTAFGIRAAELTALNEEPVRTLDTDGAGDRLTVEVGAKKIVTVRLTLEEENLLGYQGKSRAIPIREPEIEPDFSACEGEAVISREDVLQEENRALKLEEAYQKKLKTGALKEVHPRTKTELILDMETVHRESLEARLSAMLVRKKYFLLNCKDDAELRRELKDYEKKARSLGMELNKVRIAKRAQEYILDFYKSPK